jgi:hypothetical protein
LTRLRTRLPALNSKCYTNSSTGVGAAADLAQTRGDTCAGKANEKSPLTAMKPEFEKLVASALAFIKHLAGNYPLVALAHKSTGVCIVH